MSLTKYAEAELARIPHDEDGLQSLMDKNILEIVDSLQVDSYCHPWFVIAFLLDIIDFMNYQLHCKKSSAYMGVYLENDI